jgi:hypothetical protein
VNWSDDELAKLSVAELINLRVNLQEQQRKGRLTASEAEATEERIRAHIATRKRPTRTARKPSHATLEQRVARQLGQFAERLNAKYDLSEETARRGSLGTKGFKPHSLTDKQGNAKTGGSMKGGRTSIDRYISYRVRDSLVSLGFLLFSGQTDEEGRFVLFSTDDVLSEGEPLNDFVPPESDYGWSPSFSARMRALPFVDFESAAARYEALIAKLAPAR